jgi:glucose/arabinose dehydrogenase
VLLEVVQPTDRHNAGMLQFGPDGYLYVSLGEGGAASENAQNSNTLLGSILRIDVDGGAPYAVPPDNPFVDGEAPEVWAIGLRNPWRFSIDPATETMFIADVGHSDWEEINAVPLAPVGYNFGWLPMEGTRCFQAGCDTSGKTLPVLEYSHSQGCSISGGFVYRGKAIPEIDGHYFYSDWCQGWIRSFRLDGSEVVDETDWTEELGSPGQVTSFGTDAAGELYVTTWDGLVFKIVAVRN